MKEGSGYTYRAIVLIDRAGIVISRSVSDLPIGCGISEALRIIRRANRKEETGSESINEVEKVKPNEEANRKDDTAGENPKATIVEKTEKKEKSAGKEDGDEELGEPGSNIQENKEKARDK